jgi:hypothetical protein
MKNLEHRSSGFHAADAYVGSHAAPARTIALRMVRSFLMQAVMATFLGLPAARSRS